MARYYDRSYQQSPRVIVYKESSSYFFFGSSTVINNNYGSSRRSSDRDNSNDVLFGLIGVVIAIVGGYLLGKEVKKHKVASDGLESVKDLKDEIKKKYSDESTKELLANGKRFFKKMERDSYIWIAIKATVVAGGILMDVGGFAAMPALLAIGGISAAIGLTAAAIRWGFTLGDDAKMSALAQKILNVPS